MAEVNIDIARESQDWPEEDHLLALANGVTGALFSLPYLQDSSCELSLVFTDDQQIQQLNAEWRKKDKPTNVLSFPAFPVQAGDKPQILLGDVILAYQTVKKEAIKENKPLDNHISHLLLHGCLHLLGYDHETDEEAKLMEGLEKDILATIGINDPYQVPS